MQYKGEDLDLRVPQPRGPRDNYQDYESGLGNGRWSQGNSYSREPLWVDETVLACCNHAFDIAQANGSAEVSLEHLVNAMTRVEGAARVLEARGVREGQLRRESAAMVATEPLTGFERVTPRRSADLEEVLRRASDNGSRRGSTATVDDLLWVILHWPRELPAVMLLRRLTPDWQRLEWSWSPRPREYVQPHPELMRSAAYVDSPRQIMAPQPLSPAAPVSYAVPIDAVTSRIAIMEDSLRALHAELVGERKALSDLIRDTQRDVVAQRGDSASLRSDISQRLEMLERGLQGRTDTSRFTVQLGDRIQMLEKAVQNGLSDAARNWAGLGQRLQAIEAAMTAPSSEPAINKALLERIDGLETYLTSVGGETTSGPAILERVSSLEEMLEGRLSQSQRVWSGFTERLQAVERLVEASTGDGGRNWTQVAERLAGLERAMQTESVMVLDDRIQSIERMLQDQISKPGSVVPGLGDAIKAMMERMQGLQAQLARPAVAQTAPELDQRLTAMEQRNAVRSDQLVQAVRELAGRLGSIEQQTTNLVSGTSGAAGRDKEIAEIHEAIVRLSENQHTLASAISDWRHESQNDFGSLNSQLERFSEARILAPVERGAVPNMPNVARGPVVEASLRDASVPGIRASSDEEARVETRPRGHGFWWWLFGTDNIVQSNREAELRWQRMHARLKEARDRRRGERA